MKRKFLSVILAVALAASLLTGCGSSSKTAATGDTAEGTAEAASTTESAGAVTTEEATVAVTEEAVTVRVVTASNYAPFCYLDENDELTGYDVDILKAVDEIDDSITLTFEWCDWASMLPGLDAGRYDICTYQLGRNEERESMYHFGEIPYSNCAGAAIITTAEHADWKSYDDIAAAGNAKVACIVGSNYTGYVEDYLEEHPGAFEIEYYDTEIDAVMEDIVNGRVDCTINDGTVVMEKAKTNGTAEYLQVTGYVEDPDPVWYIYPDTEAGQTLSDKIDADIRTLYADGTLAEIAVKWLGSDYVITSLADTEYFD